MTRLTLGLCACLALAAGCECGSSVTVGVADAGPDASVADAGGSDGGADGGASQPCGLVTCQWANADCGPVGDGCGGVQDCGRCQPPQTCGGGGVPSRCGGSSGCVPTTCALAGTSCGPLGDGCGGLLDCGACQPPETCGGGGAPGRCGQSGVGIHDGGCVPGTCGGLDAGCGPVADGCGHTLDCGACGGGGVCGGRAPNQCAPADLCQPRTCTSAGAACGLLGDGCGGPLASCGACAGALLCGGGGVPNQCGSNVPDAGACTGLCLRQARCDASTTTVTGVVVAPTDPDAGYGQPDPIPGALVYVPNAPVQPMTQGVSCTQCAGQASGSPLVTATTGTDGSFTLTNVPCGAQVPLVVQLGKWRRQVVIPQVACCGATALPTELTRLPRNSSEGDLPLIGVVTGWADPIECVLPKLGLDPSTYSLPSGQGRVRIFTDDGVGFAGGAPDAGALWDNPAELARYDLIIADCVGSEVLQSPARLTAVRSYLDSGGRLYASHFSYVWLFQNPPFSGAANWQVRNNTVSRVDPPDQSATLDTSFPKGVTFSDWMALVGGSPPGSPGQVDVQNLRWDTAGVVPPTQQWISASPHVPPLPSDSPYPLQFTFNTPMGSPPAQQCGRVLFSDFHVATGGAGTGLFPASCGAPAPMSPQEKVLEFMILDLTSCIQPDVPPPPSCTPRSCGQLGYGCGLQSDGCGGSQDCGACGPGTFCGGGGTPGVCGVATCVPRTCAQQGVECGAAGDGCGHVLQCPACPGGQVCGAGGPGRCGAACVPLTCSGLHLGCGPAGDGCGGTLQCGTCTAPDTCGGGGVHGACGHPPCTPLTCTGAGAGCGLVGDGCGGVLDCGTCVAPAVCGGAGIPNQCGSVG
jgi:hypothetical protein